MSTLKSLLLLLILGITLVLHVHAANPHGADIEDDEFAEFEDLGDEDEEQIVVEVEEDTDGFFEDDEFVDEEEKAEEVLDEEEFELGEEEGDIEDDEFEHFQDDEEFENFEEKPRAGKGGLPDLEIAKVPIQFSNNWNSYYLEILMLAGIAAYILNYMSGKHKNQKLATAWLNSHKELLEKNFALVGDDGTQKEITSTMNLMKESENQYLLWCSGRACCEGMLVELKFLKRQDLVSVLSRMTKPASDELKITVTMNNEDMENVILFLGHKKTVNRMQKDMFDLSFYGGERRSAEKLGFSSSYNILAEAGEVTQGVLDSKVTSCLINNEDKFEYLYFSDQYAGKKPSVDEEQPTEMPPTKKVLIFGFKIPGDGKSNTKDVEAMEPMMRLVLYCIDKVKRFRLSKEGKSKIDRSRAKISENFQKLAHVQRQEAAQARREEKRRAEKDRLLNEEDPDKARKLEDKQYKKDMRKRLYPSMKQVKVRVS